ncbi:hypothetical protein CLOM_g18449, partial [Closterium sp. NIES-68]
RALAIILAFKNWRCYLEGATTTVYTDHCSLQYLKTQPTLSRRQVRWVDIMETHFNYDIVYKPGLRNKADALSRLPNLASLQSNRPGRPSDSRTPPPTFQITMNQIFSLLVDKCVIVYLDDIPIYSEIWEQHVKDLKAVFTLLQEHWLLTKGSKCDFLKDRLEFFGHIISTKDVEVAAQDQDSASLATTFEPAGAAKYFSVCQLRSVIYPE